MKRALCLLCLFCLILPLAACGSTPEAEVPAENEEQPAAEEGEAIVPPEEGEKTEKEESENTEAPAGEKKQSKKAPDSGKAAGSGVDAPESKTLPGTPKNGSKSTGESAEGRFIGTWTSKLDLAEAWKKSGDAAEMSRYLDGADLTVTFTVRFAADHTVSCSADPTALREAILSFIDTKVRSTLTREQKEPPKWDPDGKWQKAISEGIDKTVARLKESVNTDELAEKLKFDGFWKAEGGKLYLAAKEPVEVSEKTAVSYTFSDSDRTLSLGADAASGEGIQAMLPLVLKKS